MKIAMIHTPMLGRGGGDRQLLTLATELQKRGHTVEIFVSAVNQENSYPDMLRNLNVTVIPHPLGKKMPKMLTPLEKTTKQTAEAASTGKSALREYMQRNMGRQFYTIPYEVPTMINIGRKIPKGFDVINNHNYPSEWAAVWAKKRLNIPVVWMCNEPPFWFFVPELRRGLRRINWPIYNGLDKTAVNYIDEIMVLSNIAGKYVTKAYNRTSRVVRSGVDTDRFIKAAGTEVRKKHGLDKSFVLLQVGNIELNKRQTDAVKALQILSEKYSDLKLVFDGGGRRDELVRFCEKQGVLDKVLFLRSGSDEELAEVYAACDVFVFPAQITWGLAVVEAMAAAKPVVVSNRCGASEIIQNNVNGVVVEHGKPEKLAEQIERLINNPDLRRKLGQTAQSYVKNNLSWEKYAEHMENAFEKAIHAYSK
ncbi:MAG: glycosyltransferase family 4 protein [Candidatus Bathyarchaeota archaeon]|nr:glycosyltransferase family 4 protein [Candidatus Bathyarchaeota archaeon]